MKVKSIIQTIIMILIPIIVIELVIRLNLEKHNHITRIIKKPWYVILPIDTPDTSKFKIKSNNDSYTTYHPQLGWSLRPNGKDLPKYFSSNQGFRIKKNDYLKNNIVNNADIITIGDSFTHGDFVFCEESWPYILGEISNKKVVNLGVGGYGIDQAILSYMSSEIETEIVILGLINADLDRATRIVYRGLYGGGIKSKPMFKFNLNGSYEIVNQPCAVGINLYNQFNLRENSLLLKMERDFDEILFKKDFFDIFMSYRMFKTFSYLHYHPGHSLYLNKQANDNYNYIMNIFNAFYQFSKKKKDKVIIVLLESVSSFKDRIKYEINPWVNIENDLKKIGFDVILPPDTLVSLLANNKDRIINKNEGHYTPFANEIVANEIYDYIMTNIE